MDALPYIFVLDWDGTIAGKVDFQSQQFVLHNALKKLGFKVQRTNPIPAAFFPNAKLIRPGFADFIKKVKQFYAPAEVYFFIYTGSERSWALHEIGWVEKTHGVQFQRPIFTRDNCTIEAGGSLRKSLKKVFISMMRSISKVRTYTSAERQAILDKHTIIIDNNAVYTDMTDKLLLCPGYDYAVFENLLHGLPAEAKNHPDIQKIIFSFVNQGALCPMSRDTDDPMRVLAKQYGWLAAKCQAIIDVNKQYEGDDFWTYLTRVLIKNNIRQFTPSIIKKIQDAVWKHVKNNL
jgi:hypothetical protein